MSLSFQDVSYPQLSPAGSCAILSSCTETSLWIYLSGVLLFSKISLQGADADFSAFQHILVEEDIVLMNSFVYLGYSHPELYLANPSAHWFVGAQASSCLAPVQREWSARFRPATAFSIPLII